MTEGSMKEKQTGEARGKGGGAGRTITAFAENILCRRKKMRKYPAPGLLVPVDGRNIHLLVKGQGNRTIVFLSGLGTYCPSIDYEPLLKRLEDGYRCVVAEPFGYGWSDDTLRPRTAENIVSELRRALTAGGFSPPYILLGHSISGIYLLHWAAAHPEEVQAVIGDDSSVPAQIDIPGMAAQRRVSPVMPILNRMGVFRILFKLGYRKEKIAHMCGGGTNNLNAVRALAGSNHNCFALYDERRRITQNFTSAGKLRFPYDCRLLMLISLKSIEETAKKGFDWPGEHRKQTGSVRDGRTVLLEGGHYLHWTHSEEMARKIREFLTPQAGAGVCNDALHK